MNDEWTTPKDLLAFFRDYDDPAVAARDDGLVRAWSDPTYCNPPYSNPKPWVEKALRESQRGVRVVLLLRHDSSTEWWRLLHEAGAYFLAVIGRLHFSDTGGAANFPSVLVLLPPHQPNRTSA